MKQKVLIQVVFQHYKGEYKKKFIEGIRFTQNLALSKNYFYIVDLSNFYFGKNFEFDTDIKKLGIAYFKPQNIFELYKFTKNKFVYAFGLDNCNYKLLFIFIITNLLKIKLIFINYFGFFPQSNHNRISKKINASFKYSYHRFNYFFFRILSILRITSRIHMCFEASESRIKNIKDSLSHKIDKKLNLKIFSYMENIYRINSVYYDGFLTRKEKDQKNDFILFIDNGFDHPDRIKNDRKILDQERDNYYKNLFYFLLKIKKIYNLEIYYCKHPKSNYPKNEYFAQIEKEFFFPQSSTIDLISSSRFVIFSETTLINQIILKKKKIILLNSKFLGNYYSSKVNSIKNEIDLFYLSLENLDLITKDKLEYEMKKKIMLYDKFISKNIISEKDIFSYEQIKKFLLIE
jgi:hypothetical protein